MNWISVIGGALNAAYVEAIVVTDEEPNVSGNTFAVKARIRNTTYPVALGLSREAAEKMVESMVAA